MWNKIKNMSRRDWFDFFMKNLLVVIGTVLVSFGSAVFMTELNIVSGGLYGIGIIVQYFISLADPSFQSIDIVVGVATWVLWFVGLILIGKAFAIKTLLSSLLYPVFVSLFLRIDFFIQLSQMVAGTLDGGTTTVGNIILCGIFGGVLTGGGVALTFLGGGSSGGVDIFSFIMEKYFNVKQSITTFIVDAIIVFLGMTLIKDNFIAGLCGIISAFICAAMIEYVYIGSQTSYQVDIISDKWEIISKYAQDELQRGATIIPAKGGYQGEERYILRIVFPKSQFQKIKYFIAKTDPNAFVTYTRTNAVYGEGFKKINIHKKNKK